MNVWLGVYGEAEPGTVSIRVLSHNGCDWAL